MNQIMDNIKSRRSRREFFDKGIDDGVIAEIIEAGRYAPSALNKQPWKFIVIANKGIVRELSLIVKGKARHLFRFLPLLKLFRPAFRDPQLLAAVKKTAFADKDTVFHGAPVLILITSGRKGGPYATTDCALAAQNMMLAAHSEGISSCFVGRSEFLMASRAARDMIGLPPGHKIQAGIVFGYAPQDELPVPPRKRDNVIKWVR